MTECVVCSGRFVGFMFVVSAVGLFLISVIVEAANYTGYPRRFAA